MVHLASCSTLSAAVRNVRLCNSAAFCYQGRASYSMEFLKYDETPNNIALAVIEARGK